ncbi:MAG: DinB family protein [Methanoregulaceae archaeon]|nr:DinB family protein [Methanoregulaceae archaeon]
MSTPKALGGRALPFSGIVSFAMSQTDYIRAELDSVRTDLTETFPHLSDDLLNWAPAAGMRTVHGQFVEIISTERTIVNRITGAPRRDPDEEDAPLWAAKSVSGLISLLDETRAATLAALGSTDLDSIVEVNPAFAEYLGLRTVTAGELFRFIARHESYHAGQLVSYLWSRGIDPYSWD